MVAAAVKDFVPRPYQRLMFDYVLSRPRCMVFAFMGAGKSSAVLWAILAMLMIGYSKRVLILAPLRVAKSTWPDEVTKWSMFSDLRISYIGEWTAEEKAFLQARAMLQKAVKRDEECRAPATKALMDEVDRLHPAAQAARLRLVRSLDITTVNYDRVQELVDILGDKWPFDTTVADEVTRLKSVRTKQGSKRARALADVMFLPRVKRFIGLTGTPVPNGLQDIWGPLYFIDQGARLGRSYTAFENRWFGFQREADARNKAKFYTKRILLPHAEAEIKQAVSDVCFTLEAKDWFDLDEPITNRVYVDLPPEARVKYNQMQREMFTEIEGHRIEAAAAAAKSIKCMAMASGFAYVNGSNTEWVEMHDAKIEALRSVVEEAAGLPLLCAYHFRADADRIERAFPHARRLDANPRTITEWNEGKIPLLLAHPASAGHGLNLAAGSNTLVFFSVDWNLENHQQVIERIGPVRQKQGGFNRPVHLHYLLARNTVDDMILERLETKASVQEVFLRAMKNFNESEKAC